MEDQSVKMQFLRPLLVKATLSSRSHQGRLERFSKQGFPQRPTTQVHVGR